MSPNPNYPKTTGFNFKTLAGKRDTADQNIADQRQMAGMRKLSLCISLTLEGVKANNWDLHNSRCKTKGFNSNINDTAHNNADFVLNVFFLPVSITSSYNTQSFLC